MTPKVTINCSSHITLNEGDDATSVCRSKDGNPPANVSWFKDGVQIGGIETENQTLTFRNISRRGNEGTYKFVAQSHTNSMFADNKLIEITVKVRCKCRLII